MDAVNRARRSRLKFGLQLTAGALLVLLVGLVVGTLRFAHYTRALEGEARRQIELNHGIRQMQEILLAVGEAETGQRGYLLTGKPSYLQPYRLASERLPELLDRLDRVPMTTPEFKERVASINGATRQKLAELAEAVRLSEDGRPEAALALMETDRGKRYMDFIRVELDDAMRQIRQSRDEATAEQLASIARLRQEAVWLSFALVACVLAAAIQIAMLQAAQRRDAQALADSEARHRSIVEEQHELISLASRDGTLNYVNPAYGRLYGREPDTLLGTSLFDLVPPGDRTQVRRQLGMVLETGRPAQGVNRVMGAMGEQRWIAWVNSLQHDAAGQPILHSVGRDITEQRRAEEALQASERFLQRTGEVAGVGGWLLDVETGRMQWSAEMKRIHEVPGDYAPTLDMALAAYDGADKARLQAAVEAASQQGVPFDLELRLTTGHGRQLWVRSVGEREIDERSGLVRIVGACQDVTGRRQLETNLRELNEILEHSPDFIIQADRNGRIHYMNPAARRALGIAAQADVSDRQFSEFNPPETNARYQREIMPSVKANGVWIGETQVLLCGNRVTPVNHLVIAHRDPAGWIARCSAVMRDISADVAARQDLARKTDTLSSVIEAIPAMVAVLDRNMSYQLVNRAFERWRGLDRSQIVGKGVAELLGQHEFERSWPWAQRALAGETVSYERDYPDLSEHRHVNVAYIPLRHADGSVHGFIGVIQDVTRQRENEQRLLNLAERDALTGALNRVGFDAYLEDICSKQPPVSIGLLYVDLDHFKPVNDTHGHLVGDELLSQFAQRLQTIVRPSDAVARLGGDEFAIALAEVGSLANAIAVAAKVVAAAGRPFQVQDKELLVGASVGVTFGVCQRDRLKSLLGLADAAVYEAKARGRGQFFARS